MKIISGGQTGVDRAGLDVAIALNIEHGGWCPKGRRSESGIIPERYSLAETSTPGYEERTFKNLTEADATLILFSGALNGGTKMTFEKCRELKKSCYTIDLTELEEKYDLVFNFLVFIKCPPEVEVLNVAGPRESKVPGIHSTAFEVLHRLFSAWKEMKQ